MKSPNKTAQTNQKKGLTLLELTIVVVVLMSLVALLFASSRAWKAGADRSACIMNQSNVQKAMRAHVNMYGSYIGDTITDLPSQLIGSGLYVASTPVCPSSGTYTFGPDLGQDVIPPVGTIYMPCSLATDNEHVPEVHDDW